MIPNPEIYYQTESQVANDLLPVQRRKPVFKSWLTALLSSIQWCRDVIFNNFADGSSYDNWTSGNTYAYLERVIYIDNGVYECQKTTGLTSFVPPNIDTDNWLKIADSFIGIREQMHYTFQKLWLEYALNRIYQVAPFSTIDWGVTFSGITPTAHTTPPYTQIYISKTPVLLTNFWLSNGGVEALTSFMPTNSIYSHYYLGNAYAAYSTYQFTIHVPSAVYTQIADNTPTSVPTTDPTDPAPQRAGSAIRAFVNRYAQAGSIYKIVTY
jgi:hypothetical protein